MLLGTDYPELDAHLRMVQSMSKWLILCTKCTMIKIRTANKHLYLTPGLLVLTMLLSMLKFIFIFRYTMSWKPMLKPGNSVKMMVDFYSWHLINILWGFWQKGRPGNRTYNQCYHHLMDDGVINLLQLEIEFLDRDRNTVNLYTSGIPISYRLFVEYHWYLNLLYIVFVIIFALNGLLPICKSAVFQTLTQPISSISTRTVRDSHQLKFQSSNVSN